MAEILYNYFIDFTYKPPTTQLKVEVRTDLLLPLDLSNQCNTGYTEALLRKNSFPQYVSLSTIILLP